MSLKYKGRCIDKKELLEALLAALIAIIIRIPYEDSF